MALVKLDNDDDDVERLFCMELVFVTLKLGTSDDVNRLEE